MTASSLIPIATVGARILLIRGQKVMLDSDLAELYGVPVRSLNQAVIRNRRRFPKDFVFQLTEHETAHSLRSQTVISNVKRGGRRYRPYAFTEQGVAMLSSVLHSDRAIQVNIAIMRAFVQLRQWLSSHADLARKLDELEQKLIEQDEKISSVFAAIRQLMTPEVPAKKGTIGFKLD